MLGLISGSHPDPPAFAICQPLSGPSPITVVWVAVCASMCQHAPFGSSWVLDLLALSRLCWSTAQWLSRRVSINRPCKLYSGPKFCLLTYHSDESGNARIEYRVLVVIVVKKRFLVFLVRNLSQNSEKVDSQYCSFDSSYLCLLHIDASMLV